MPQLAATLVRPRQDRPGLAILLLLVVFAAFSVLDTLAKLLVTAGYPPLQVSFLRYLIHAVVVLAVVLPREGHAALVAQRPGLQVLRAMTILGSTLLNFAALKYLPLTVTIAIFFSSPLIICLLSIPILGERVGPRRIVSVLIGFAGVLVITRPWSASFHPAMLLSLGAAICGSLYYILTRLLAGSDGSAVTQIYSAVLPALVLAPVAALVWIPPASAGDWAMLVGTGLAGGFGHALVTVAYRYAEASRLAPVVYSQILYVTFLSWLVFGVLPTGATIVGTAIIVASGVYIWLRERHQATLAKRADGATLDSRSEGQ